MWPFWKTHAGWWPMVHGCWYWWLPTQNFVSIDFTANCQMDTFNGHIKICIRLIYVPSIRHKLQRICFTVAVFPKCLTALDSILVNCVYLVHTENTTGGGMGGGGFLVGRLATSSDISARSCLPIIITDLLRNRKMVAAAVRARERAVTEVSLAKVTSSVQFIFGKWKAENNL